MLFEDKFIHDIDEKLLSNPLRPKSWQWLKKQELLVWIFCLSDSIFRNAAFTNTDFLVAMETDMRLMFQQATLTAYRNNFQA